jgi:hypothetical protein
MSKFQSVLTENVLLRFAAVLLMAAGTAKVISAFSGVRYLANPDPVLSFMSSKQLFLVAGSLELLQGSLILLAPSSWYSRMGLLAVCTTFVGYRAGLSVLDVHRPCPCLGRASDWLHITPQRADLLALLLLGILLSIALTSLVLHRRGLSNEQNVQS